MITRTARLRAALVLALSASLATGCAATTPPPEPETTAGAEATPTAPVVEPSAEPTDNAAAAEDPTCETLIADETVADFKSVGWTARADPFYIGELEIPGGLQCVWADFEGQAGDHVQIFGWAPIAADAAADAEAELVDQGWTREKGADGVYITESSETTLATDAEGYGMTYLFGDGWVMLADTKQGLVLIEWPRA
jgi:hypothetical protein